ncbi:SET domain-containing protein [Zymoseptoria tritici IPO323]|uniref:SET domain-containing protein n=1 Tax=Zymoseptoria tritici (strain CBS 115943 / IPO323) TaxID=336722 RepID=F9X0Q5_ZYMTI|nr:SET domain-containing protein [Zymoseptoria tritici IPO323]EGP91915.1 SET domain-containing protein [Zymoseptoria tritici IPO323]
MATPKVTKPPTRANFVIDPSKITGILTHRQVRAGEEYLILHRTTGPASAEVASWHTVPELRRCLYLVQEYLDTLPPRSEDHRSLLGAQSRKRKSPHDELSANGTPNGFQSPFHTNGIGSPSPSPSSSSSSSSETGPRVFNGSLSKRAGFLLAQRSSRHGTPVNATRLPTPAMLEAALKTATPESERAIRDAFVEKLKSLRGVTLENDVDSSTPSLNFTFIKEYVLREGVSAQDPSMFEGCTKCKPDMGQNVGCEYTQKCGCLEYAAVDEQALQSRNPEMYEEYLRVKENQGFQRPDLPKRFPYTKPSIGDTVPQRLVTYYRDHRHAVYECNDNCACGPRCKSRLVQKGRRVPLIIFKTPDRGWAVKCGIALQQGQFIDTYLGEVITSEETDRREENAGQEKASYLYSLDKFVGDPVPGEGTVLTSDDCYVIDGQHWGNVTRFINHSCDPNCRQYTVSYDKNNILLYNLAFFAYTDIPAGTELTFDYMDKDEMEVEDAILYREQILSDPANQDRVRCNCGSVKCRGVMWV